MRSILMKCGSIDSQNLFTSKSQKKEKILNVTIIAWEGTWWNIVGIKNRGNNFKSKFHKVVTNTMKDGYILVKKTPNIFKNKKQLHDGWMVNSIATWHMTLYQDQFCTWEPISREFIKVIMSYILLKSIMSNYMIELFMQYKRYHMWKTSRRFYFSLAI